MRPMLLMVILVNGTGTRRTHMRHIDGEAAGAGAAVATVVGAAVDADVAADVAAVSETTLRILNPVRCIETAARLIAKPIANTYATT